MLIDRTKWMSIFGDRVRFDEILAPYVAYKIGGPAKVLVLPNSEQDIIRAVELAHKALLPIIFLGSGTNVIVPDEGLAAVVLYLGPRLRPAIIELKSDQHEILLRVPAACSKAKLLDYAIDQKYSGLEFSAGIPGTMGGAVYMNAGTKWGSYAEVITRVHFYSLEKGLHSKAADELGFRYRSIGEGILDGKTVVLSVEIKLSKKKSREEIIRLVDEILIYRGRRQPLYLPNCGSVFKNPPEGPGAGRLIEACGLKGRRVGGALVSTQHSNFILNTGRATAHDVKTLIAEIQNIVKEQKGVILEREVIYL